MNNVFGYLLVPQQSLSEYAIIARDYWQSTVEMNEENCRSNTKYYCYVVCVNCSWWQRKKLSFRTGIPMNRIINVFSVKPCGGWLLDFSTFVAVDSMVDDTFFGRTKVYASEKDISREDINPCTEVVYAW